MSVCRVEGCEREPKARALCGKHWQRWWKHGDPLAGGPTPRRYDSSSTCDVEGCKQPPLARGLCNAHYLRWHKHGDPLGGGPRHFCGESDADRIARCLILGPDCWEWDGWHDRDGYAIARTRPRVAAHTLVYEFINGPIPDGLEPDHVCRNRGCCRPSHLDIVTHAENMRRAREASCR